MSRNIITMPTAEGAPCLTFALLATLSLLTTTLAQQTEAFTDPLTGINFQRFFGAKTQFAFGIALPENPSTDCTYLVFSSPYRKSSKASKEL